jgi:hypothetical protein
MNNTLKLKTVEMIPRRIHLVEQETEHSLNQKVLMEMERDADSNVLERLSSLTGEESVKLGKAVSWD